VRIDIITIFPEYFGPLRVSLLGKAVERGIVELGVHDLRMWTRDAHRTVDDAPFGGGPGMVMTPGPWGEALDVVTGGLSAETLLVVPTPAGIPFRQEMAAAYAPGVSRPNMKIATVSIDCRTPFGAMTASTGANTIGRKVYKRRRGRTVYEPSTLVHQWGNPGARPLELLIFNINRSGTPAVVPAG